MGCTLLAHASFALPVKLFLLQPTIFLTFTLPIIFPIPLGGVSELMCGAKLPTKADTQLLKFNQVLCWGSAFQKVSGHLPANERQWMSSSFCLPCNAGFFLQKCFLSWLMRDFLHLIFPHPFCWRTRVRGGLHGHMAAGQGQPATGHKISHLSYLWNDFLSTGLLYPPKIIWRCSCTSTSSSYYIAVQYLLLRGAQIL